MRGHSTTTRYVRGAGAIRVPRPRWCVLALLLCGTATAQPSFAVGTPPSAQVGAIARDPTLGRVFLAQPQSNVVFVLSRQGMRLLMMLRVPATPSALAVDPQRHRLYVASDQAGMVSAFDDRSGDLARIFPVSGAPVGLALADQGKTLLVADGASGAVEQLSLLPAQSKPVQMFSIGPAAAPTMLFAPQSAAASQRTLVWARGFTPGEAVQVDWGVQPLMTATANAAGIVTAHFQVPRGADLGQHLVVLQGASSTTSESGLVNVIRPPTILPVRRGPRHKPTVTLLQRVLAPTIMLPLPASLAHMPAHRWGQAQAGIRVPMVLLAPGPVLLLLVAFRMLGRRRKRKRASKLEKQEKSRNRSARGRAANPATRR